MSIHARNERAAERPAGPKSQLPVVIGSFVTGVAAMTLVGVLAPTIAAAGAPNRGREAPAFAFEHAPDAFARITPAQRAEIDRRLAAAAREIAEARGETDRAVSRLNALARRG